MLPVLPPKESKGRSLLCFSCNNKERWLWVVAFGGFLRSCCFVSLNSDIEFILVCITGRNFCGFGLFFRFLYFYSLDRNSAIFLNVSACLWLRMNSSKSPYAQRYPKMYLIPLIIRLYQGNGLRCIVMYISFNSSSFLSVIDLMLNAFAVAKHEFDIFEFFFFHSCVFFELK